MLAVLEGLANFIEHGVSFLFLPTDFQALSFTSPRAIRMIALLLQTQSFKTRIALKNEMPASEN
jgi:hypothetical protein